MAAAVTAVAAGEARRSSASWIAALARVDVILLGLLAVGALTRLYRLGQPEGSLIFDEAYYVQDARVLLGLPVLVDHLPAHALSGLDPNSEHPPLAKLVMAASMHLLGPTAFAWRLPSVVLGVVSIWAAYRIVLAVGGERSQARLAAFILAFENLAFVHGRIATLDVYVLAFALVGTLLYVSRWFELAGIAFGLATLCKINGLFGVVAMAFFELGSWGRERPRARLSARLRPLASMAVVYLAFTFFALGALDCAWTTFRSPAQHLSHILHYGASLARTSGMQGAESTPLQWWLNESPMTYLMVQTTAASVTRTTVFFRGAMTEYVIFAAPFALLFCAREALRSSRLALLAVSLFVANYAPVLGAWALASRISYIFYALQSLPAIAMAIALVSTSVPRLFRWSFVALVLFSFATWFPFRWY